MSGMQVFKIIRQKLGVKPWKMKQLLEIEDIQRYVYLERKANKVTLRDLVALYKASHLSLKDFWALIEQESQGK
jgi:hypothetical protein